MPMKQHKLVTVLYGAALLAGIVVAYQLMARTPAPPVPAQSSEPSVRWEVRADEQSNVTVTVMPLDLSPESPEWRFDVSMDTHSVELDQDMASVSALFDDSGREYRPLAWDGATGGHHREGVLIFKRITPTPRSLRLQITGIAEATRTFVWQL